MKTKVNFLNQVAAKTAISCFVIMLLICGSVFGQCYSPNMNDDGTTLGNAENYHSIRMISDNEWNGTNAITLPLNQDLLIQKEFTCNSDVLMMIEVSNINTNVINNDQGSENWYYGDIVSVKLENLLVPLSIGQSTITYSRGTQIIKKLTINVVDPVVTN